MQIWKVVKDAFYCLTLSWLLARVKPQTKLNILARTEIPPWGQEKKQKTKQKKKKKNKQKKKNNDNNKSTKNMLLYFWKRFYKKKNQIEN